MKREVVRIFQILARKKKNNLMVLSVVVLTLSFFSILKGG